MATENSFADKLIESARQAEAHSTGEKKLRRYEVELLPLPVYSASEIRSLRNRLNLTQAVMAGVIGVSQKTIESWETGTRKPNGAALRVMKELDTDEQFIDRFVIMR
jgi:putative transcriptional regulator